MPIKEFVEHAGNAAEIAGVVLIIGGLIFASVRYAVTPAPAGQPRYTRYRHDIERAVLLGLEVLVAADIVRTVAFTPTMDSVNFDSSHPLSCQIRLARPTDGGTL